MADIERDIVLRVKSETDQAQGQFKNLKQELRSIENELNKMAAAGQTGTAAFNKLQQRAGEVKDQIGDTKNAIKALSSDTFKLDAFAQGAQGIAGGFAAAQGAMALFGSENKAVEEAIKKTQGAMALLQGVTAITNILQKDSAFSLNFLGKAQKANAAATEVGTKATKGFSKALIATGVGALVAALGFLIANFEDVKKVVLNLMKPFDGIIAKVRDFLSTISFGLIDNAATAKTKENADKVVEAFNKTKDAMKEAEKTIERRIELAKAEGKSAKEIYNLEKQLADLRVQNLKIEQAALQTKVKAGNATDDEKKRIKELTVEIADANNKRLILDANFKKGIDEANQKAKEKRESDEKKVIEDRKKNTQELYDLTFAGIEKVSELEDQSKDAREKSIEGLKDYVTELGNVTNAEIRTGEARKQIEVDVFKTRQANINKWGKLTIDSLNALSELNNAFSKKDEASQRNAFERNKKFSIAQALISTFLAVNGALTAGGNPVKLATGAQFVEAGIALTTGLAQVAKITKTQFQGGSTSGEGGGISAPSIPGVNSQPSSMSGNTPTIGSTQLQLDAQGNLQQGAMRTYVLETDISDKQKRSQRLSQTATLGK
jgi:hypothetical protein